jgi:gamma-glutamyl:cysteine ligase YbdK (ATP-grasp superfamily)
MTGGSPTLRLWAGTGVELEYMIVDAKTLDVAPIADQLLRGESGTTSDVDRGAMAWSNELVLHVVELKTNGPVARLNGLADQLHGEIREINRHLEAFGARLMPTGMHPWMNPARETRLWPHEYAEVYRTYDRIFGCHTHGYANLQSMHLNLSFGDDAEFGRLHAAARVLLPLLPAMAASSPFVEGRRSDSLDHRMAVYRHNAHRVPSVAGAVIPEPVYQQAEYERVVFGPIERDLRPLDPTNHLHHEFANARGAIPRFSRGSLELRLMDTQECPAMDIALAELVIAVLRLLVEEQWSSHATLRAAESAPLVQVLDETTRHADASMISQPELLRLLGWRGVIPCSAGMLWRHLAEAAFKVNEFSPSAAACIGLVLREGPLARRLARVCGPAPGKDRLRAIYGELCGCLATGRPFEGFVS